MQNLHKHTSLSNLFVAFKDSAMSYDHYAQRAIELGHKVLTSVEHGWQGNFLRCWEAAQKYDLKFVYGTEAYWVRDRAEADTSRAHILILARNMDGIYEINEVLSEANETGFHYVPRLDIELLRRLSPQNVLVTTACVSFWGKIRDENLFWHYCETENPEESSPDAVIDLFNQMHDHFGSSLYLEVQAHNTEWQKKINKLCLDLHYRTGVPLIVGLDSHYISQEHIQERKYLREESGTAFKEGDHEFDSNVFEDYPDDKTVIQRFRIQGILNESEIQEAMDNTDIALEFDDIVFDRTRKLPTIYPHLTQEQRNELYLERVNAQWQKFRENIPEHMWAHYEEAIEYETHTITSTDTSDYFLLDSDMVALAKKKGGYLTPTGRGSGGSFFTNTLLGLSTLDRLTLPVPIYPDRFVTAERLKSSLPDLDLNVAAPEPFEEAQQELLGEGHVYKMISFGTLKEKAAFKMYARAVDLSPEISNEISKQITTYERAMTYAEDDDERELIQLSDYVDAEYLPYIEASKTYRGIVVSKSPAPCGYLLYNGDIRREIGIMRVTSAQTKKVVMCTVIDGYTAEAFGYVKNDILTVAVCKINRDAMLKAGTGLLTSREIISLTENDPATWEIFHKGYTQGINQCQSDKTTLKLKRYKPRCLKDLSAFVAAVRPGFASMIEQFLSRQKFSYGIKSFDNLLKNDTTGSSWLLYQEDIMKCLSLADFKMVETYPIIKAISKKKLAVIESARERFTDGFSSYIKKEEELFDDYAIEQTEKVWQVIQDSSSYSFNASHSVSVSLDALYGAYLKAHYPHEYYTTLLDHYAAKGNKDKTALIKAEMRRAFGIRIAPCRFGQDNRAFAFDKSANTIMDALPSVKELSVKVANALYKLRDYHPDSFVELLVRMSEIPAFNKTNIEVLIRMGYFECYGSAGKLLDLYASFYAGAIHYDKKYVEKTRIARIKALKELESSLSDRTIPVAEQIAFEIEHYGTPITIDPSAKLVYAVLDVEPKRSPTMKLYGVSTGRTGTAKVRKALFEDVTVQPGDLIHVGAWENKPDGHYVNGKWRKIPGSKVLWLLDYTRVRNQTQQPKE